MREYIICFIFWLLFTIVLHGIGKPLCGERKGSSYYFVAGYLVYSFAVAAGGMIIQFLNLPWNFFAVFMGIIWAGMVVLLIIKRKEMRCDQAKTAICCYIRENWMLLAVCAFLCAMLFLYHFSFWYGNHLDDGYYVTKAATLPYNATGFRTNYSVGVVQSGIDSYVFNTWELEASFYIKILGVKATLFLRLFQSAFHYFLLLNCLKLFAEQFFTKVSKRVSAKSAQFVTVIVLLFGAFYVFLMDTNLFFVRDMFQFNSAMYYGASVTKMLSILLMLVFFIEVGKINIKMILTVIGISVVLISKSSIALPLIIVGAFAYLEVSLFCNYEKRGKIFSVLLGGLYILAGIVLKGNAGAQKEVYQYVLTSLKSPVVIVCTVLFIFSFFWKEKIICRINSILLVSAAVMLIPQVNDLFEMASVYRFVAGRAWSTLIYTYVMINVVYLFWMLCQCCKSRKVPAAIFTAAGIFLVGMDVFAFNAYGGELFMTEQPVEANVKPNLKTMLQNPYFVPHSTIELGAALETLGDTSGEKVLAVMPEGVDLDGTIHNLAVQIRIFAPDIVSVSASDRYPVEAGSELAGYSQSYFEEFAANPSDATAAALGEELKAYGVNCVIVRNADCGEYLSTMGYHLYQKMDDSSYYIWSNLG